MKQTNFKQVTFQEVVFPEFESRQCENSLPLGMAKTKLDPWLGRRQQKAADDNVDLSGLFLKKTYPKEIDCQMI